jgi:nucleotide-binding universal stress UspA family protein
MFKKILVPLDGSKLAEETLGEVRKLAGFHGSKVVLLRVAFALVFPGVDPTEAQIKVTEEAEGYLARVAKEFRAEGVEVGTVVRYGFPAEEILDHLERGNFDLLAMATHGRTGPARLVMGSVAEKVLRSASVPVLLFRASGKVASVDRQPISAA